MTANEYFESYEDLEVHRLMLDDKPRTLAYKNFILENKNHIRGKTVMDVGCGTGILSIFCAQAGASKVYAVEASKIGKLAELVIEENNFSDVITVFHTRVEDLDLDVKVDIIVSEWMGFYLLHEGMLDSVIVARDKFLKSDGFILPETAEIFVAPCHLPQFFDYWDDIYGVKMKSIGKHDRLHRIAPAVTNIDNENIIGEEKSVLKFSLKTVKLEEFDMISRKVLTICTKDGLFHGLCIWFACEFPFLDNKPALITTHPGSERTHWKQTAIVLPDEIEVEQGYPLAFHILFKRRVENQRQYDIELTMLDPDTVDHPVPCNCLNMKCIVVKTFLSESHEGGIEDVSE